MELNNYSLKAVKMMETPNGISFSADIYYDSKMIGNAYNCGNGGITDVYLCPEHGNHLPVLDEAFVERLFTLNDYESIFIEFMKSNPDKGLAIITLANLFDLEYIGCGKEETAEGIIAKLSKSNSCQDIESVEIFRSLDDFIINNLDGTVNHAPIQKTQYGSDSDRESVLKKISDSKKIPPAPKDKDNRKKPEPEL